MFKNVLWFSWWFMFYKILNPKQHNSKNMNLTVLFVFGQFSLGKRRLLQISKATKTNQNMICHNRWQYVVEKRRLRPLSDTTKRKFTRLHQTSPDFTGLHWTSLEFSRLHRSSSKFTRIHRNCIEFNHFNGFAMQLYKYSLRNACVHLTHEYMSKT